MENGSNTLEMSDYTKLVGALRSTASAINQSLDLMEVLDLILNNVGQVVPNDAANIMLVEGDSVRISACKGYETLSASGSVVGHVRKIADLPNLVRMIETGQPIILPDTQYAPDWINFKTSTWIHSYISAPIRSRGETLGFINLNSRQPGLYTQRYAERLVAFADQAAVAIRNAKLYEEARREIAERKKAEEALQRTLAELEERVERRTLELRQANERLQMELNRRRLAEEALEKERALLEQRIQERTAELSNANAELARAAQTKDAFLASMSHELRTPLNAILNVAETLQEQKFGPLNEKQLRLAKTVEESGRHLLSLINDILDISKIGAGRLDLTWDIVPVRTLCDTSVKFIDEMARKKSISVSTSYDENVRYVRGDMRRLKQVLVNLLSNAVKFTPNGGVIGLTVQGFPERQQAHFSVWDSGIGISEADIKLLFKPFTQLDNSLSRQFEGTGLGLALAYRLVEMHGGSIQVESHVGAGSRFTVILEWKDEPSRGTTGMLPDLGKEGRYTEWQEMDLADPTNIMKNYLNELSIDVSTHVLGGTGPMSAAARPQAGLLIVDGYSIQDPFQAIRSLYNQGLYLRIPIIILEPEREGDAQATRPNYIRTLHAPFSRQDLRSVIRSISPVGTASLIKNAVIVREKRKDSPGSPLTILIAEDNETAVRILSEYLEINGFRYVLAYNGIEAVERTKEVKPDMILMDIQMPKMDGIEAIRQIRRIPEFQHTPIVALTALAMPGDKERCLEAGANDYISKPITLKTILEIINTQVQRRREAGGN